MTGITHRVCFIAYIRRNPPQLKRVLTICLLSLHLFTLTGYHLVFEGLESGSRRRMNDRLDGQDFRPEDLLELRVAVSLPYPSSSTAFERIDGDIDIDGVHYSYVGRRMVNDTLILQVIQNHDKTRIRHARETFFALVNDMHDLDDGRRGTPAAPSVKKPFSFDATTFAAWPDWPVRPVVNNDWMVTDIMGLPMATRSASEPPPEGSC
jgi:hypothetical protein